MSYSWGWDVVVRRGRGGAALHSRTLSSALSCLVCVVVYTTQTRANNARALAVDQPLTQTIHLNADIFVYLFVIASFVGLIHSIRGT